MRAFRKILLSVALFVIIGMIALGFASKYVDAQNDNLKNRLLTGSFIVENAKTSHIVKAFSNGINNYLFMPQYADSLKFDFDAHHVLIDGTEYFPGDALELKQLEGEHKFNFVDNNGTVFEKDKIEFMLSGNIPTIFIDSDSGHFLENGKKDYKEYCGIEMVNSNGTVEYRSLNRWSDKIRGRGNSTWRGSSLMDPMAKNPYNLYLGSSADLFGMGSSKEWVLLANLFDKSNIRNKFVYDFADYIGLKYSPESVYADVYIDNEYRGVYQLSEKIQVCKERVDIGNDGILFSMEAENRITGMQEEYTSSHGQELIRIYPETNSKRIEEVFKNRIEGFEKVLFSDFNFEEIDKYIDVDSWAKIGILEELFVDYDAWKTSQYFYIRPEDGKIYAGPVWDFDNSAGNNINGYAQRKIGFDNLLFFRSETDDIGNETLWFYRLMQNKEFYDRVCEIFSNTVLPGFEKYMNVKIEEYINQLGNSQRMNCIRWGFEMNDEEVFKDFVLKRISFLKRIFTDREPYSLVTFLKTGLALGYFENEVCPADIYGYKWYFDAERTKLAEPFVPGNDTVLFPENDVIERR